MPTATLAQVWAVEDDSRHRPPPHSLPGLLAAGFARMIERGAAIAGFELKARPHMLRHACGFKLANEGHDTRSLQHYLGHKNIAHTVRYTELAPDRFKAFWRD